MLVRLSHHMSSISGLLSLLAFILLSAPASAETNGAQKRQEDFVRRIFAEAGFPPMSYEEMRRHEVRHIVLNDPYGMYMLPGIALERRADGVVLMTLQYRDWQETPVPVDAGLWTELVEIENELYAPPPAAPPRVRNPDTKPPPPPPICHGWSARFAAPRGRTASWSACGSGRGRPGFEYAERVARLAIDSRAGCRGETDDVLRAFMQCFSGLEFANPALAERFEAIEKDWNSLAYGPAQLMAARQALQSPGLRPGTQQWDLAREEVAKVSELQNRRLEIIQRLGQLLNDPATNSSLPDREKLRRVLESWTSFRQGQQDNYIRLLEDLLYPANL